MTGEEREAQRRTTGSSGGTSELEAARALADLAQMALLERSRKPLKSGSASSSGSERSLSETKISKPEHESLVAKEEVVEGKEEIKHEAEVQASHVSSLGGSRGKQSLTEAEREERRMRRILANRESARQTIRRRQALREELTKKVADLSLDNQNIKMEKELVLKEYQSLNDRNKQLQEMARATRFEFEPSKDTASGRTETSTSSSTMLPQVVLQPYAWSPWPSIPPETRACYEQQGIPPPYYWPPPCAWFYPPLHQPYNDSTRDRDGSSSSRKHAMPMSPERACSCFSSEACRSSFAGAATGGRQIECSVESHPLEARSEEMLVTHPAQSLSTVNPPHLDVRSEPVAEGIKTSMQEREQGTSVNPQKRVKDAVAATEARKRRMELTKQKHMHGRDVRRHS